MVTQPGLKDVFVITQAVTLIAACSIKGSVKAVLFGFILRRLISLSEPVMIVHSEPFYDLL